MARRGGAHLRSFSSQTIALRFPQDQDVAAADDVATGMTGAVNTMVLGDPRLALLDPAPMVPQAQPQAANQAAAPEEVAAAAPAASVSLRRAVSAGVQAAITPKSSVALAHRRVEQPRQGFMLNDAQIASIKERLHLTPDQERMWPGVEAALRNIAYAKTRDAHKHGAPAGAEELASLSPESTEVQDLEIRGYPADHELLRRAEGRSAQPRPRHGIGSARVGVLMPVRHARP